MTDLLLPPPNVDDPEVLKRYLQQLASRIQMAMPATDNASLASVQFQIADLYNQLRTFDVFNSNRIDPGSGSDGGSTGGSGSAKEVYSVATPPTLAYTAINFARITVDAQDVYLMQVNI